MKHIKTKYPNYNLSSAEKQLVITYEQSTHFDLMNPEEVIDVHTFKKHMDDNIKWYRDHVEEQTRMLEEDADDLYMKMTDRTHKIDTLLGKRVKKQ